jgi:hypothetical protein
LEASGEPLDRETGRVSPSGELPEASGGPVNASGAAPDAGNVTFPLEG